MQVTIDHILDEDKADPALIYLINLSREPVNYAFSGRAGS
jgi:hypothetical protein